MRLLIGSDVVPTSQSEKYFIEGDIGELFGDICDKVKNADRTIINLECALTETDIPIKKIGPNLKASPKCASAIKKLGVTDVMLSNNHVFDYGIKGLNDTVAALEAVGLPYTGIGKNDTESRKPYVFEQEGKKIGIINVCEHEYTYALPDRMGANPFDPFITMQDIRELRPRVDFLIVLYHGGKEYCRYPSPRLRSLCREMVNCGADAVITQHSHCIGCYEEYHGSQIVYGQGNLHFCKPDYPECWYTSLLIELTDRAEGGFDIDFYPLVCTDHSVDIAKGKKANEIMEAFVARNEELKNGKWLDGWHTFCESVADTYKNALRGLGTSDTTERMTQMFAHYLDCEAHTDVWRELFKTYNHTNEK